MRKICTLLKDHVKDLVIEGRKRPGKAATQMSKRYDISESESESVSDSEIEEDSECRISESILYLK